MPYCAVKGGAFEARLSRAAAFQLLAMADYDEATGRGALRLGGRGISIASQRMTKTIARLLVVGLAALGVAWWIGADAQPVTVDEIGDENQTVPRGQLPLFAAKGDEGPALRVRRRPGGHAALDAVRCGCVNFGPHLEPILLRESRIGRPRHLHERRHLNRVPGYHA